METAAIAKEKGLAVVSGFVIAITSASEKSLSESTTEKLATSSHCTLATTAAAVGSMAASPSGARWNTRVRNWPYYTWLSGDFNVEQHVHSLDKAAWVMHDEVPLKATGLGGRQVRTDEKFGHIFDHMATVYEYKNGDQGVQQLPPNGRLLSRCFGLHLRHQRHRRNDEGNHRQHRWQEMA